MTLNEYLGNGNIFQNLKEVNPELTFLNVDELDGALKLNYGDKPIFSKVIPYDLEIVAGFLNNLHGDNWLRLVELNALGSELAGGQVRTITENIDNTENRNSDSETVNKVSAFNSDELLVDDGNNNLTNDVLEGSKTRVMTDKKQDITTLYNSLSLSHKNHIMIVVLKDVTDFLTLSIY